MADNQQQVKKTPPTTVPPPGDTQTQLVPAELTKASTSIPTPPAKTASSRIWGIIGVVALFACVWGLREWFTYNRQLQLSWPSFVVGGLLWGMMVLGGLTACLSIGNVSRSRAHFEKQRAADIVFARHIHHSSVRERVRDEHFAPYLPGGSIAASLPHRMHHVDRLQIILRIVQQDETEVTMPALDDLRTQSYSVEKALWHNWVLRIVISVLLITGILGTLVGVHASMEGAGRVNIMLLPQAFLPSLVAVVASIVLILAQAWYRYLFDSYLGRVDCHTLRYYFPWFRPDVLNAQSLKQFESSYGQLSEALKRLGHDIARADIIPEEMNKVANVIRTMQEHSLACASRESVNAWLEELKMRADGISTQVKNMLEQQEHWADVMQQLSVATNFSGKDWDKANSLYRAMKSQTSKMEEVKKAMDEVVNSLPDAYDLNTKLYEAGSSLSNKVYEIACHCNRLIEERYSHDVSQANTSQECISKITQECRKLSAVVQTNVQNYRAYVEELESAYTRIEGAVAQSRMAIEAVGRNLSTRSEQLKQLIVDYNNEPILHKWQIVLLCAMGAAFLINLCMTLI